MNEIENLFLERKEISVEELQYSTGLSRVFIMGIPVDNKKFICLFKSDQKHYVRRVN